MAAPAKRTSEGEIQQVTPYQRWLDNLSIRAELETGEVSGVNVAERVLTNMLEADTLEAAFAAQDSGVPSGKDMVDKEIRVTDFTVQKSDQDAYAAGLPVYLRINAVDLFSGEVVQFCTGAPNVVMLLHKADQLNALPLDCRIASKTVPNGELLTLKLIPKRVL